MNDWNPASGTRYIGVTERGDAGADLVWADRIKDPMWAGAVLITKRMSARFNDLVLACPKPVVVHCTCTGNGGTWAEPAAPGGGRHVRWDDQDFDDFFKDDI